MVIERQGLSDITDTERAFIAACLDHNLRIAGDDNHPKTLISFHYGVGFVFEKPNGSLWRIAKCFPKRHEAFAVTIDGLHSELWGPGKRVKVPELYLSK